MTSSSFARSDSANAPSGGQIATGVSPAAWTPGSVESIDRSPPLSVGYSQRMKISRTVVDHSLMACFDVFLFKPSAEISLTGVTVTGPSKPESVNGQSEASKGL